MLETELGRQTELFSPFQSRSDLVQLEGAYIFLAAVRPRPQLDELQVLRVFVLVQIRGCGEHLGGAMKLQGRFRALLKLSFRAEYPKGSV